LLPNTIGSQPHAVDRLYRPSRSHAPRGEDWL